MNAPLVVLGDSLLDIDTVGTATRFSPDGPVPVIENSHERRRPGGAALTACLAALDGRPVRLVTPLADDTAARQLRSLVPPAVEVVALPWSGTTPVKHRVRADGHTVARIDRGGADGRIGDVPDAVVADAAAVVVADYGYLAASCGAIRQQLADVVPVVPVVWDPHPRGSRPVPGVRLVVPNEAETGHGHRVDLAAIGEHALRLRAEWHVGDVAVTAGSRGAVTTIGPRGVQVVPAELVTADPDPCGAGDRFAAAAAWALADGALPSEAVAAAVHAASRFVADGGLAAVSELDADSPARIRVATGGCFDLLHAGHVATLEAARQLGDELIVCVNSDASVRRLKGSDRPLQPVADRVRLVSALACVDRVEVFDEDTPAQVLRRIRPDVWVKGGDYTSAPLPEAAELAEWGGRAVTVPYLGGRSTSGLVELARQALT